MLTPVPVPRFQNCGSMIIYVNPGHKILQEIKSTEKKIIYGCWKATLLDAFLNGTEDVYYLLFISGCTTILVASPPHSPGTSPQFSLSNIAKPIRYSVRSRAVFLPAPTLAPATDPAPSKSRHSTIKKKFWQHPTFLARTNSFIFNYSITGSFWIRL